MRTTLNTIYSRIQTNLGKITTDMSKINSQISSGQQMSKISDDPVNLVSALRYRSTVVELDQYTENIQSGNTIITAAESALTQMKELALRAKTLAIQATDPAYTTTNREAIAEEIKNMFEQAISLGNTQINGKYIFGGFRTTGYTDIEPAPFIIDKGDGHWVNGTVIEPLPAALTSRAIPSAATAIDLAANDLLINGVDIGAVDLTSTLDTFGVNMTGADKLKSAMSLYVGNSATADTPDGFGNTFTFDLNGVNINFATADLDTATQIRDKAFAAINLKTPDTGVRAIKGLGPLGVPPDSFPANSLVFQNAQPGDYSTITVSGFSNIGPAGADLGFSDFTKEIAPATPTLTTQIYGIAPPGDGVAPAGGAVAGQFIDFTLNGVRVAYTTQGTVDAQGSAQEAIDAINAVAAETGVTAIRGDGNNGGALNSVILKNTLAGDESAITLAGLDAVVTPPLPALPYSEIAITGLNALLSQRADATHNTGQISLSSSAAISITTSKATGDPLTANDSILARVGFGGGDVGNFDAAGDGKLVYGYPISAGELKINGLAVPAPVDDSLSDVYADASAAAKATAINSITNQTGVSAVVINAEATAASAVTAGTESSRPTGLVSNTVIWAGDLAINGTVLTDIAGGGAVTHGLNMQKAANAQTAINLKSPITNVTGLLTTLLPNSTAATPGRATAVSFNINGTDIDLSTGGFSAHQTAADVVAAINAVKAQSGVEARIGDDNNGGIKNSIVLYNSVKGNEGAIVISKLDSPSEDFLGLANNDPAGQGADNTHNTGEISLDSKTAITLTSPTTLPGADVIINELGFSSWNTPGTGGDTTITGAVNGLLGNIAAGDLYVNGLPTVGNIVAGLPANGVYMGMAASAKDQIEAADPTVQVHLTTMAQGAGPTTPLAAADSEISFMVNGESVTVAYPLGTVDTDIAALTVQAINDVSTKTGVQAYIGTGAADGSPAGSAALNVIVFKNMTAGNDSTISISGLQVSFGNNDLGFNNFSQTADASHNSGEITISSATSFDLSTPGTNDDSIINRLGLGFGPGLVAGYSEKNDGILYSTDGPGDGQAILGASPIFMDTGDLIINGQDIFATPTAVLQNDQTSTLIDAINAKTTTTGVQATRGADGLIRLKATDGRNIHLQTSTNGEAVTHLTNGDRDRITFGSLQLRSDRKFSLETVAPTVNADEPGLATLGLAGGEAISGEPDDVTGDGKLDVFSIHDRTGSVRYTGDRVNDLEIKIGKTSTMVIGENGKTGVMDTTIFDTLKALEDYLRGNNFTAVTGIKTATDTSLTLNSKKTGLEPASQLPTEDLFTKGAFTVSILDHDYSPPRTTAMTIAIDPEVDTLDSVGKRIDGIPRIKASWSNGKLTIASDDPKRYTINLTNDSSNFLTATGVNPEFMQKEGVFQSIADLDTLMDNLTRQVSDFGSRANRIDIQSQIYSTMTITTKENLSEVQDTDMIKAVMDLKTKETAYQAALSAAAKTMQLSLVDYLK